MQGWRLSWGVGMATLVPQDNECGLEGGDGDDATQSDVPSLEIIRQMSCGTDARSRRGSDGIMKVSAVVTPVCSTSRPISTGCHPSCSLVFAALARLVIRLHVSTDQLRAPVGLHSMRHFIAVAEWKS